MQFKTCQEIINSAMGQLDLDDEFFIDDSEYLSMIEKAIKICETHIHNLQVEDQYFLTYQSILVEEGVSEYDLPANIFANKIRSFIYRDSNEIWEIKRLRNSKMFLTAAYQDSYGVSDSLLGYILLNHAYNSGPRFRLWPQPTNTPQANTEVETLTTGSNSFVTATPINYVKGYHIFSSGFPAGTTVEKITGTTIRLSSVATSTGAASVESRQPMYLMWYVRAAHRPISLTDTCDIPEFYTYVEQFVRVECLKKDIGNPMLEIEQGRLEEYEVLMNATLSEMVPDQDDTVEQDLSAYEETE